MLGAEELTPVEGDIGPRILEIPGIPNGRFLPLRSGVYDLI